mmetsp:Transcript_30744/g.92186  ORF Transcript_30744/g.92186 Transcript_30744/m.92186 type:complete len:275 (-) Transcript_30744:1300-2124(-)
MSAAASWSPRVPPGANGRRRGTPRRGDGRATVAHAWTSAQNAPRSHHGAARAGAAERRTKRRRLFRPRLKKRRSERATGAAPITGHRPRCEEEARRDQEGHRVHDAGHRRLAALHGDDHVRRDARPRGQKDGLPLPLHVRARAARARPHVHQHAAARLLERRPHGPGPGAAEPLLAAAADGPRVRPAAAQGRAARPERVRPEDGRHGHPKGLPHGQGSGEALGPRRRVVRHDPRRGRRRRRELHRRPGRDHAGGGRHRHQRAHRPPFTLEAQRL